MVSVQNQRWYLGLDLSETHLGASLLDRDRQVIYPLHWQLKDHPPVYRFPMVAYFEGKTEENDKGLFCNGLDAIKTSQERNQGLFIEHFLSYFNLCIPYFESDEKQWQPKLAYRDRQTIPLYWLQKCLQAIVATLRINNGLIKSNGLDPQTLKVALSNLASVVVNCPASWSEAYQFNVREVLLGAELVKEPSHVVFVEETIAIYLAHQHHHSETASPSAPTLVIHAGVDSTELMLIPGHGQPSHNQGHWALLNYGTNALEQDLLNHVIGLSEPTQTSLPVPIPAIADIEKYNRYRLDLFLRSSDAGRALLQQAHQFNLTRQNNPPPQVTEETDDLQKTLTQQNLMTNVVGNINLLFNKLLTVSGIPVQSIGQILLSGNTINYLWPYLEELLTQKLPQATITKLHDRDQDSPLMAQGLALVALSPGLVNSLRHQYGDLFLFYELLSTVNSDQQFTWEQLQQTLKHRGLNLPVCRDRISKFLGGELPPALLPDPECYVCLDPSSVNNPDYANLKDLNLFEEISNELYQPNLTQIIYLRNYLRKLWNHGHHQCNEPLFLNM